MPENQEHFLAAAYNYGAYGIVMCYGDSSNLMCTRTQHRPTSTELCAGDSGMEIATPLCPLHITLRAITRVVCSAQRCSASPEAIWNHGQLIHTVPTFFPFLATSHRGLFFLEPSARCVSEPVTPSTG